MLSEAKSRSAGKNKIILGLLFTFTIFHLTSCDNAQAEPYKDMYEWQVVINDSLQAEMDLLGERMNIIYSTSIRKIDSLKTIIAQQSVLITGQDSIIANAQKDFQVFLDSLENDLEHLSDQALQNLINIQKR
jgi:hypothetical protein